MTLKTFFWTVCACLFGVLQAEAAGQPQALPVNIPEGAEILKTLRKEHPRIMATQADFDRIRQMVKTNETMKGWGVAVRQQAEKILSEAPSKYEIPDGLRLLATSRRVVDRMQTLGMMYRLEGDKRFSDRAWAEIAAAMAFPDWNPKHFLDVAEMTHGFAIGYDWFYDAWSPAQRAQLKAAMIEKGIRQALDRYEGRTSLSGFWPKARHNWNQVCNGGIGTGTLAIADEEPALAGTILNYGMKSIQLPMMEFAPDGAWAEGPGYWGYATIYNVYYLAALQSALGTDYGLSKIKGFSEAGMFPIYASGPSRLSFNYADAGSGNIRASQLLWMASQFHRPEYAAWQLKAMSKANPLDLLWYDPAMAAAKVEDFPLDRHFRNAEVAMLRSSWTDPDALFVGFKAGDNKANHSNLDLGSFVLDAQGVRWGVDLGADNYNLPGYFGKQRWTYYRMRAEGHNTLVINPGNYPDQIPSAAAKIVRFQSQPQSGFAIADLSAAYANQAGSVKRGLALVDRKSVLVQDEIQMTKPGDVWWFFHTPARIELGKEPGTATLSMSGKVMKVKILSPAGATFQNMEAASLPSVPKPEKQGGNNRVRKLGIELKSAQQVRLAVLFTPVTGKDQPATPPAVKALDQW